MGKNKNKKRGNAYELSIVKRFKKYFPNMATSRNESKAMDDQGCDFVNTPGFTFQAKTLITIANYHKILSKITLERPVLIHKLTKKSKNRYVKQQEYVVMRLDDFIELCLEKNLNQGSSELSDTNE